MKGTEWQVIKELARKFGQRKPSEPVLAKSIAFDKFMKNPFGEGLPVVQRPEIAEKIAQEMMLRGKPPGLRELIGERLGTERFGGTGVSMTPFKEPMGQGIPQRHEGFFPPPKDQDIWEMMMQRFKDKEPVTGSVYPGMEEIGGQGPLNQLTGGVKESLAKKHMPTAKQFKGYLNSMTLKFKSTPNTAPFQEQMLDDVAAREKATEAIIKERLGGEEDPFKITEMLKGYEGLLPMRALGDVTLPGGKTRRLPLDKAKALVYQDKAYPSSGPETTGKLSESLPATGTR